MAHFVLTDADFSVNAVDLSDDVESITFTQTTDTPETTAMGDSARTYLPGLNDATFTVNFHSDFAASSVFDTLNGIYAGGAAVAFTMKATSGATSATNEEAQGSCILTSWNPFGGSVGSVSGTQAQFQVTGAVTYATS
jgi:hypothetical protein